jgi:signal transduction histidine kinase
MGAATSKRRGGSAAAVLDFAVAQILGDDTALGALPAVLDRMVATFGLRAALAFQPAGGQPSGGKDPAVLAVHPPGAADQALLARIGVLSMAQRDSAPGPLAVTLDGLHRLVGDLLMLDRLEAGALPLDLAPVSIADLAAEAVRSAAPAAAKQGIAIEVSTGDGPLVAADHRRLMQVLDNLIANAVKFSNRNRRVLVTAGYDGGQWRIDVTDTGIGIPPEEAGQLFSRFVRASNARTAGLPGTGLGLSIVKVLTEMHGGRVTVDSTLGRGSGWGRCSAGPGPGSRGPRSTTTAACWSGSPPARSAWAARRSR